MGARILRLPLFVLLMGAGAALMLVPAVHALDRGDHATSRVFLYGAILSGFLALILGLAMRGRRAAMPARGQLLTLFAAYGVLPLMLALPFHAALPGATLGQAWFEMVSSMTTTGATLWDNAADLNLSLHLWRAIAGWFGGFLSWLAAVAILAPMNLGGAELRARVDLPPAAQAQAVLPSDRLARHGARLLPVYAGLTAVLWLGLVLTGDGATVALIHAMGVISTSGISSLGYADYAASGLAGEVVVLAFMVFALSRAAIPTGRAGHERALPWRDVELRLGLVTIAGVTVLVFARTVWLVHDAGGADAALRILRAFWGILFTAASFLTTTGFESRYWPGIWTDAGGGIAAQVPGLVLIGLALVGGGVGTAAGGVKLLRIHAVLRHAGRETGRLIEPASVGGARRGGGQAARAAAAMAWVFFMLFALAVLSVMMLLALAPGTQFETILLVAVASITTTGQLALTATDAPVSFAGLTAGAQAVAALAMILGRLEMLALVALFNPDFWRR